MATSTEAILAQIDAALAAYDQGRQSSKYEDLSDRGDIYTSEMITRLAATIDRLSPPGSQYRENAKTALKQYGPHNACNIPILAGALKALRADYEADHLRRVEQLVQADLFADFLEMAEHLWAKGTKIRQLCSLAACWKSSSGSWECGWAYPSRAAGGRKRPMH